LPLPLLLLLLLLLLLAACEARTGSRQATGAVSTPAGVLVRAQRTAAAASHATAANWHRPLTLVVGGASVCPNIFCSSCCAASKTPRPPPDCLPDAPRHVCPCSAASRTAHATCAVAYRCAWHDAA
jgi:hypothetical protein